MASEILLYGQIGASFWDEDYTTSEQVVEQLAQADDDVTVRINSYGGAVYEGIAMYNAIKSYDGSTVAQIDSWALSAASLMPWGRCSFGSRFPLR